jgi:hypothetical protein
MIFKYKVGDEVFDEGSWSAGTVTKRIQYNSRPAYLVLCRHGYRWRTEVHLLPIVDHILANIEGGSNED